ncbi:glycosyltransferase family 1 protein [Clostridium grantii]|uniref:Glycosyltransferase involved in cell wall bisynthesis n=1 Tax=Clostridium grantii DSM 8605 TaxID=1121316 RepID=A0A1M5UZ21_9CLOT|nr:glycosyltransferase family 1 protein [Clostridium grantii]SHH68219.1 Glycosyltransferase involved in cell wall bisynthesis [Clostridium grantii DSM 8605]
MDKPLRILHVVVNMNRGGAETLIMNLYRNMDRSKIQFDFLTCKEGVFDKEILEMGGAINRIPYVTDVGHFEYIKALNKFFVTHPEYKIVHSHMDKMSGFILRAAKKAGVSMRIAHSHNTSSEGSIAAKMYKWYSGISINKDATQFLACSNEASKWLFGKKSRSSLVLKNGIELDDFGFSHKVRNSEREKMGLDEKAQVIGHVGRFCEQKNHSFIIDIFDELLKINPNAVLILVGDGPLRTKIESKVTDMGLTNSVKFLGVRGNVNELLQAFDSFIFPSLHEGLPVTLVEAQASGLSCFISEAITPEVNMETGLINYLPINDKYQWVEKINAIDKDFPREIAHHALNKKGYDIKNTAKVIERLYLEG